MGFPQSCGNAAYSGGIGLCSEKHPYTADYIPRPVLNGSGGFMNHCKILVYDSMYGLISVADTFASVIILGYMQYIQMSYTKLCICSDNFLIIFLL